MTILEMDLHYLEPVNGLNQWENTILNSIQNLSGAAYTHVYLGRPDQEGIVWVDDFEITLNPPANAVLDSIILNYMPTNDSLYMSESN